MDLRSKYIKGKIIGAGGTSIIYAGKRIADGQKVAIKEVTHDHQLAFDLEAKALKELSTYDNADKYIVTYVDHFSSELFNYLITDFVQADDLFTFMQPDIAYLPEELILTMSKLTDALIFLHDHQYAHRDIKPENILKDRQGNLLLIDFGVASSDECLIGGGTRHFLPPERFLSFNQIPSSLAAYQAHDMWSLGLVFYNLAHGKLPFRLDRIAGRKFKLAITQTEAKINYQYGTRKQKEIIHCILKQMLIKDWTKRATIHEIRKLVDLL